MKTASLWSGIAFAALAVPALGAARIDAISVTPNPVSAGSFVSISLSMNRPTPLDLAPCDLELHPGDGEPPVKVTFGPADGKNKSASYAYKKAGTYKMVAKGAGKHACTGERATEIRVGGASGAKVAGSCPEGWTVDSHEGAKFTCRPNPPSRPLKCEGGTRYFSENGMIGCK
jgi:hypothetical protein